mmetsp:Transcript_42243/g.122086  ORF Transcript_42243/g.122086 Transcript_42243/m.122086 type:complete len:341 (+) Transcript_42243:47-1069(+)
MYEPSVEERLARLNKTLGVATSLLDCTPSIWENGCEQTFSLFRIACVHLRREQEALDTVEDKVSAWKFVCKACKARPFLHERGNEVIRILMKSQAWMQAFQDTGLQLDDLPPDVQEQFKDRAKEVIPDYPVGGDPDAAAGKADKGAPPAAEGQPTPIGRPSNMAVVVQRCTKAKILLEERAGWWDEIGYGLVVFVSFSKGAKEAIVQHAARFLLTAKLATRDRWSPGARVAKTAGPKDVAASLVTLCSEGEEEGILVVPQESLVSELAKDNVDFEYSHVAPEKVAHELFKAFVAALKTLSVELVGKSDKAKPLKVVSASFQERQYYEMSTAGAHTHSFHF